MTESPFPEFCEKHPGRLYYHLISSLPQKRSSPFLQVICVIETVDGLCAAHSKAISIVYVSRMQLQLERKPLLGGPCP